MQLLVIIHAGRCAGQHAYPRASQLAMESGSGTTSFGSNNLLRYGCGSEGIERPGFPFDAPAVASAIEVVANSTRWEDVRGYSRRQRQAVPVGGFTGSVTLRGDLASVLPFLAWGQLAHVGKDATKGNGWYRLRT